MKIPSPLVYKLGIQIKRAMRLRGGGSALPGLVVEKLDPGFLKRALADLPHGVVVISGTNGKTTTTKMVAELFKSQGLEVFTNQSGSNFIRGIIAALLDKVDPETGKIRADIAVLELDEAHAVHFIRQIKPDYSLILNVLRDQLDRFGEIDHTAKLLAQVVESTGKGVVLNREDPLVLGLQDKVSKSAKLQYFGLSADLKNTFPSDSELRGSYQTAPAEKQPSPHRGDTIVDSIDGHAATFVVGKKKLPATKLKVDGVYNILNGAAALTLVRMIMGDKAESDDLLSALAEVKPAFGRGEAILINGQPLEIILVKNPSGFRLAINSYADKPADTMIAINDSYADGRDMSWLWDVDFESFRERGVHTVSGVRAYDMALRLQYDEVEFQHANTDLAASLSYFLKTSSGPRRIYCTYTAMLAIRRILSKSYDLEAIE